MSEFLIAIPEKFVDRARLVAARVEAPVEELLMEPIRRTYDDEYALPVDVAAELSSMKGLTDDTLWTLAREEMPVAVWQETDDLLNRGRSNGLSDVEKTRLQELVQRGDRLSLRKGAAAAILTQRGYDIDAGLWGSS